MISDLVQAVVIAKTAKIARVASPCLLLKTCQEVNKIFDLLLGRAWL